MDIFQNLEERQMSRVQYPSRTKAQAIRNSGVLNHQYVSNLVLQGLLFILLLTLLIPRSYAVLSSSAQTGTHLQHLGNENNWQKRAFLEAKQAYENGDYTLTYRISKPLAVSGYREAMALVAVMYDAGQGVKQSDYQAFRWYKKAAVAGDMESQHNLAVSYAKGHGVKKNINKALKWWRRSAMKGHVDAQFNLGIIYATGNDTINADLKKSIKWWRMAAMNGDPVAQFNLGALYANGTGMSSRTCEASRWWKKSAENGFEQAKAALMYIQAKEDYDIC